MNHRHVESINFDELYQKYNDRKWIVSDPIQFIYQYQNPKDQEFVGFIVSIFSYGSVPQIVKAVAKILRPMGKNPVQFLKTEKIESGKHWDQFYYRLHKEEHLLLVLKTIQKIYLEFGSIEYFYKVHYKSSLAEMLSNVAEYFWLQFQNISKNQNKKFFTSMKFLINSPQNNSACKRHLMFLRWMVRSDEIDLGIWSWLKPSELVVPLDTHMVQKSYELGLRKGPKKRAVNWKLALEVTNALRKINAIDPIKYDFPITRLGIIKNKETQSARSN